jgi:uncharacterized protein (TIGR00255 family)
MTIKSMTGFGRAELEQGGRVWVAEIRCVNNRFLDLKMKLPRGYAALEERIRRCVVAGHARGRVDLVLTVNGDVADRQEVVVNFDLARSYMRAFATLAETFDLPKATSLTMLAGCPDVLVRQQIDDDLERIWPNVQQVVEDALAGCDVMRSQEGQTLAEELQERLNAFAGLVDRIEQALPELLEQRQRTLQERLTKLLGTVQLDPARLVQEVAILADKSDVTEELVRLRSHIQQFSTFLTESGGVGRKLDFLIQEFLREVNTLASKISDAAIAHLSIDLKSELEKMREQVQNIE